MAPEIVITDEKQFIIRSQNHDVLKMQTLMNNV